MKKSCHNYGPYKCSVLRLFGELFPQNRGNYPPIERGRGLLASLLLLTLAACSGDNETVVQSKVSERVQAFREKHLAECRTTLRRDAEHRVDSLLLAEAKGTLDDSLARLRPFKPVQPPPLLPIDSLTVRPIFDRSPQAPSGN